MKYRKKDGLFRPSDDISRRGLLAGGAALGATAMLGLGIAPSRATADTPKRGGKFIVAIGSGASTDTLNPETNLGTSFPVNFNFAVHGFLVEIDQDGNAIPDLAESWEASPDAKTWRFKIRKGVEFHDGRALTAQDVVNSINIHRTEETPSSAKALLDDVESVTADGDAMVIRLNAGNADVPYLMADYRFPIYPAKGEGVEWESGVGCGGYVLQSFEPGVRAHMTRNPNYWKPNRAWFDEVEMVVIIDAAARTNALVTGGVDAIDRADLTTIDLMSRSDKVNIIATNGGTHYTLPMNATAAPFDNVDVRLALKHAIDRQALVDTVLSGYGSVANDQPIPPSHRFYNPDIPQREYDPEKARFHLDKSGVSDLSVELHVSDAAFPGAIDAAVLFSEHAKAAGIEIKPVRHPTDGYWTKVWMQKPWSASYWSGQPTADVTFSQAFQSETPWNEGFWKSERFDTMLAEARGELDEARRRELYGEMQLMVHEEGSVLIPMFANNVYATGKDIGHGKLAERVGLDSSRAIERWWKI